MIKHSYKQGRQIHYIKSDKKRVRAVCKHPCPWYMYASLNFDKTFQMKQVGPGEHKLLYSPHLFIYLFIYVFIELVTFWCIIVFLLCTCLNGYIVHVTLDLNIMQHTLVLDSKGIFL